MESRFQDRSKAKNAFLGHCRCGHFTCGLHSSMQCFKKLTPLQSLGVGRPPTINLAYADCEFPIDEEESMNEKGEIAPGCA